MSYQFNCFLARNTLNLQAENGGVESSEAPQPPWGCKKF